MTTKRYLELVALSLVTNNALAFSPVKVDRLRDVHERHWRRELVGLAQSWSPQDLVADNAGFSPIPDDDYIKLYQARPELWPVEFFVIVFRRCRRDDDDRCQTQILVRESANGTSKWGLGTGVPVTRWLLASQDEPPFGYRWSTSSSSSSPDQRITIDASIFPEFPDDDTDSWQYGKIELLQEAFRIDPALHDLEMEKYASQVRDALRTKIAAETQTGGDVGASWESSRMRLLEERILCNDNSITAIQGVLRMCGVFDYKSTEDNTGSRHVNIDRAPDPADLADSMRAYTMFPQMPDPMPLPSTAAEDLKLEIQTRPQHMSRTGRDPHQDRHGRKYTHISTSNVSNTIHGIYLTIDATNILPDKKDTTIPPALDLFGTKRINRHWKSLEELKVLDQDTCEISSVDTKPTFISGFIVQQLVREHVIHL